MRAVAVKDIKEGDSKVLSDGLVIDRQNINLLCAEYKKAKVENKSKEYIDGLVKLIAAKKKVFYTKLKTCNIYK